MTQEPDFFAENEAIDAHIRQLATDPTDVHCPAGIEVRVLGKVQRRRRVLRVGYAAAAVFILTAIGVSSFNLLESNQPDSRLANNIEDVEQPSVDFEDLGLAELDSEYLASPPPVISLNLISEDQIAVLNCLEALGEELE